MNNRINKKNNSIESNQLPQLPTELIGRFTGPFDRFLKIEAAAGLVLICATIVALGLSNSPWRYVFENFWNTSIVAQIGSWDLSRSLRDWINDSLMTLFFFLVALELKRELVMGELKNPRMAALSIIAAIGGMIVPALVFLVLQLGKPGMNGWGTVMATDTAFVIGCLALLGRRIPQSLRVFMLSLAIVDDIGAILIVAIGYGHGVSLGPLALAVLGLMTMIFLSHVGVRSVFFYSLMGICVWIAMDSSGIHATITGVIIGLMTPTGTWVSDSRLHTIFDHIVAFPPGDHWSGDTEDRKALQVAQTAAREALSPVERLEMKLHPWVSFVIMPLFALTNAGVVFSIVKFTDSLTIAIFLGFVLGKPIGVFGFSWLAVQLGIATRPPELSWRVLIGGGVLAGIGFTMALFIGELAFNNDLIDSVKLGILSASVFSVVFGLLLLWGKGE